MANERNYRDLPRNIEAEQVVLGAVLLEPDLVGPIALEKKLHEDHFYDRRHRVIFKAIRELLLAGKPCDIIMVANKLDSSGEDENAGGRGYLNEILDKTTTTASVEYYIKIVKEKAALREIISAGRLVEEMGYNESVDVEEVLSNASRAVSSIESPSDLPPYVLLGCDIEEHVKSIENAQSSGGGVIGVPSGFDDLDYLTTGFRDSDFVIIAARPSVGKTAFALSCIRRAAEMGYKIGLFSLEMSREQILNRLICSEGKINLRKMRGGTMNLDDWRRLAVAAPKISDLKIYVDSDPASNFLDIVSKARMMKDREDVDIIFIDYLQLMSIPSKGMSRENVVSEMSRSLKKLARELDICVVSLSQLNRNTESRATNKRPTLADLRESGCLAGDTLIRTSDGGMHRIDELVGQKGIKLPSLNDNYKIVTDSAVSVFSSGNKEVFRLKTASGNEVKATSNHKFLTVSGWKPLSDLLPGDRIARPRIVRCNNITTKRERALRIARALDSDRVMDLATSDVYWDKVVSIDYIGYEMTYDIETKLNHNFVANDIIVHNSIEQDADIVMFIYREDYYSDNKDDMDNVVPVEIIIAKQRNGPLGTVYLSFHKSYVDFYPNVYVGESPLSQSIGRTDNTIY
jgi:replicative DNA helicase